MNQELNIRTIAGTEGMQNTLTRLHQHLELTELSPDQLQQVERMHQDLAEAGMPTNETDLELWQAMCQAEINSIERQLAGNVAYRNSI